VTGTPAHGRETAERWLASQHRSLRDGLDQFLDPEAGLREAMLHAEHATLLSGLASTLDTEADLAAILPLAPSRGPRLASRTPPAPQRPPHQQPPCHQAPPRFPH
jgi:hypothetical protein